MNIAIHFSPKANISGASHSNLILWCAMSLSSGYLTFNSVKRGREIVSKGDQLLQYVAYHPYQLI